MAWLHTWVGLLAGWILFFVFLTGTLGYVKTEIDMWMRPEQPANIRPLSVDALLAAAERRLRANAPDALSWGIEFPDGDDSELVVSWRVPSGGGRNVGTFFSETLDLRTGLPIDYVVRETGGGEVLYAMHFRLHYVPNEIGVFVVGICTMFMLLALMTGLVARRRLFRDFFMFRPGNGRRTWLDAHVLMGVTAFPFHLMIAWSGLLFHPFFYMPVAIDALYPAQDRRAFLAAAHGYGRDEFNVNAARVPLVPLAPLMAIGERRWGSGKVSRITVGNPDRQDARVMIRSHRFEDEIYFDGSTGALIGDKAMRQTATGAFVAAMTGLHVGPFEGPLLRGLYVMCGLLGTATIGTGLVLWLAKRKARLAAGGPTHLGITVVDTLNVGTIVGLPIGIAAYFWANRLLPVGMEARAAWEVHAMFMAWGASYLYAHWRRPLFAWSELCVVAAALFTLIPFLNAVTTDRNFAISVTAGDWVFAGFDLSAIGAGFFFAILALKTRCSRGTPL